MDVVRREDFPVLTEEECLDILAMMDGEDDEEVSPSTTPTTVELLPSSNDNQCLVCHEDRQIITELQCQTRGCHATKMCINCLFTSPSGVQKDKRIIKCLFCRKETVTVPEHIYEVVQHMSNTKTEQALIKQTNTLLKQVESQANDLELKDEEINNLEEKNAKLTRDLKRLQKSKGHGKAKRQRVSNSDDGSDDSDDSDYKDDDEY